MSRPIDDAWFHRLKSATRDVVKLCGGVERAAEIADLSPSQISRCQSSADPAIITIPAALALEADCGQPTITAVMADMNGRHLSDGASDPEGGNCIVASHSRMLGEIAKLVSEFAAASSDGKFTPGEIDIIERAKAGVENSLNALGQACAAAKAKAGAASGPRLVDRN